MILMRVTTRFIAGIGSSMSVRMTPSTRMRTVPPFRPGSMWMSLARCWTASLRMKFVSLMIGAESTSLASTASGPDSSRISTARVRSSFKRSARGPSAVE